RWPLRQAPAPEAQDRLLALRLYPSRRRLENCPPSALNSDIPIIPFSRTSRFSRLSSAPSRLFHVFRSNPFATTYFGSANKANSANAGLTGARVTRKRTFSVVTKFPRNRR